MNRMIRRAAAAQVKALALTRPATLTEVPSEEWPKSRFDPKRTHVWQSRKFLVQMFDETCFQGIDTRRISVARCAMKEDGNWEENITWEELMQVKREIGFGHWYAVEVYPPDTDIVNVANMRHLWLLAQRLEIGWTREGQQHD